MTDSQSARAETSPPSITGSHHATLPIAPPVRRDTCSSNGSGPYSPIPYGRWTLPFHGNCPRCRHHHKAVLVKVDIGHDSSQVSYIRCEQCKEKWAAFGGRNTTQISLLSGTTTEPDPLEKEFRYSLIEVVRAATNVASLGGIAEFPAHGVSQQPSIRSRGSDRSDPAPQLQHSPTSAVLEDGIPGCDVSQDELPRLTTRPAIESVDQTKADSRPHRLMSKLKRTVSARLPILHRNELKRFLSTSKQSKMSARQLEKSPVRSPPVEIPNVVPDPPPNIVNQVLDNQSAGSSVTDFALPGPSESHPEVAAYIESLDKSELASMSEQERASWMREKYTSFMSRQKSINAPLDFSTIVQTSIRTNLPHSGHRSSNPHSVELLNAGTHIEGLERLLNEAASRRSTITISDIISEAQTASDENSIPVQSRYSRDLEQLRRGQGLEWPRSMHNAPRSPPHPHLLARYSIDMLGYNDAGSTSSIQGQASSRWSDSTLHGTVLSDHGSVSRGLHRRPSDQEVRDSENSGLPRPTSSTPRDDDRNEPR